MVIAACLVLLLELKQCGSSLGSLLCSYTLVLDSLLVEPDEASAAQHQLVKVPEWPRGHGGFVLEALEEARPYTRLDRHKRLQIQP